MRERLGSKLESAELVDEITELSEDRFDSRELMRTRAEDSSALAEESSVRLTIETDPD